MSRCVAAVIIAVLFASPFAYAYEITYNLAFRIGSDKNDTIRLNDANYNGNSSTLVDAAPAKEYIAANRTNSVLALVFAGAALNNVRLNTSYSAGQYLLQMRYASQSNKLLLAFTNGTWQSVEDDLDEVERSSIIAKNFGGLSFATPLGFLLSVRLEYGDIDIGNSLAWSGIGKLRVRNRGGTPPNITIERVSP